MADADREKQTTVARDTGLPIARELSEMMLTQLDLKNSLAALTLWSKMETESTFDPAQTTIIRDSLFRDGITNFVGCFDSKNAFPLVVNTVFRTTEGIDPYFRWLRALRNSYTAHRHGGARQCAVGAIINPVSGQYLGGGHLFSIYRGPSAEGHANLLAVIRLAIAYVDARVADLRERFDAEARAIPPDVLLGRPALAVQPQAPADMGKSRGAVIAGIVG
jgi:hypothetical protein